MTEYGLSVSLDGGTPMTPMGDAEGSAAYRFDGEYYCCAPPRPSRMKLGGDSDDEEGDGEVSDGEVSVESISPRVLFPEVDVRRRLDFSSLSLSPIVRRSSLPLPTSTDIILVCDDDCSSACCSVGECGVCYMNLPLRSNHIFTMCGHLFCVRCLFKWWDTATTCPICRAELFQHEVVPLAVEAVEAAGAEAVDAEIEPDNNRILLGRVRYNRYGGLISSDSESDTAGVEAPEAEEEEAPEAVADADSGMRDSGRVPAYIHTYIRNIARGIRRENWYNHYNGGMDGSDSDTESDSTIDLT